MEWRKVYDLEVSENGDVRNPNRNEVSFYVDSMGYPTTTAPVDGPLRKKVRVHRLVAKAFVDNPHNYNEVNHKDGNRSNNHYSNLEWCTHSHNIRHCRRDLKKHSGEGHFKAKLREHEVKEIYKMAVVYGLPRKIIGRLFGVSACHVSEITTRKKCWFNVNFEHTL